jgi:protein transport protein SEC24
MKMVFMSKIGERRIRVITLALPTTTNLSEVYASADQVAIATFLANKAVERSLTNKLEDSRDYVFQKLVELLVSYKTSMTSSGAGASAQLAISDNMKMLPVLVLGLLKNVSFVMHALVSTLTNPFPGWNSTKCTDPS